MRKTIVAGIAAAWCCLASGGAVAATFSGYTATTDLYFNGAATFDFDPTFIGGSIVDPDLLADITLWNDLSTGFLTLFDVSSTLILDGALVSTMLSVDNGVGDDAFSMLFDLDVGASPFAIATFTGDLDGLGFTDFFTDGVLFKDGELTISGATQDDPNVVPLPAGMVLLVTAFAGLGGLGAARRRSS